MKKLKNYSGSGILKLFLLVSFIVLGNYLTKWIIAGLDFEITPADQSIAHRLIIISMIAYVILMAIPFVPGAEIGLVVMMILGPEIVPLVYLCTLASLSLSFMVGRYIPEKALINLARDLHLRRASQLGSELEKLDGQQRLKLILSRSPKKLIPVLLKYRYLALLVAINMPGNIVIGGGGGIALMAGMSRIFSAPLYLLTIAVAVAPIPLLLVLFGENFTQWPLWN